MDPDPRRRTNNTGYSPILVTTVVSTPDLLVPSRLPQRPQVDGEVVGRAEGVGVVVAQHPPIPGQGVLVQHPRRRMLPQRPQVVGEAGGRGEGVGVVVTVCPPLAGQRVLVQFPRLPIVAE